MSSTNKQNNPKVKSIPVIRRSAIDPSGRIGSLYDGYRDCILGHLNVKKEEKLYQPSGNVWCDIIHGNNDQNQNLFRLLGIDEQLRLSILLELAPKTGIASLIDYPYTTKANIRLFYYTYEHQTQQLPDTIEDARAFIQPLTSDTKATHIITRVSWGIDFNIVLELPHDNQAIAAIDHVLENISSLLRSGSSSLTLKSTEEKILTKILHTKVYSNIPTDNLYDVKTLLDVCQYIEQNQHSAVYHPVSYNLLPIKWLYPYYTGKSVTFILLPKDLSDNIEEYVLQLRKTMKKRETSIYNKVPKLLCGYLNERLSNLQKQWSDVENMYTNEIARLSKLVIDIRSGRVQIPTIDQALKKNEQTSITNTMVNLTKSLNGLRQKGKFITGLTKQQFKYVDVTDYGIDRVDNKTTIERKLIFDDQRDCVLCSNSILNETKPAELKNLRKKMVEELNNNSNLRLIYADFSYCSFELQNMMKLPSNKYKNEHSKPKQKEAASFRELQTISSSSIKAQTSVRSPTKTYTSLPASSKVYINDTLSTKTQTSAPLPTKSPTFLSPVKENQTPVPTTTKTHTTGPVFAKEQIDPLSATKPQTYMTSFAETQTFTPAPTEAQTTDPLPTKTHSYTQIQTTSQSPLPPSTEVHTLVTAPTKLQKSAPSIPQVPSHSPRSTKVQTPQSLSTPLPADEIINLLLLGETGVGKSTFINALANYLTFNTLQQGETGHPVVLIPVSFLITVGDTFDEYTVKFGDVDGLKNEDFSHPGQSVTQRCKSYDFRLHSNDKKILRIIDTPGFGDTRGLDQDDRNMAHILEYVKNLPHLNAICFLLKPNESQLNIFFRSCLSQLFSLLDENIGHRIVFCFTNSRSTFYTPGDTAPLLKKMLNSFPKNDVPFTKDNTFCFDSESFRYLVALQNQLQFNDLEREEYEMSWTKSVAESNRLVQYVCEKLTPYRLQEK